DGIRDDLVTGVQTCALPISASLKHEHLVPERKQLNAAIRQKTFDWLASQGYSYVSSQSNCFMLDAKRPAKEVIDAMAARNVYIRSEERRVGKECRGGVGEER